MIVGTTATKTSRGASSSPSTNPTTSGPTATLHLAAFQSPSGNIGCIVAGGTARCDIKQRSWTPPPRPPGCPSQVDFGQGLQVGGDDVGHLVCAGDTALNPSAAKLAYGTRSEIGSLRCDSATSGMTCTDAATGHGFFIASQSYRGF
ncbi:MAG: hypothetical protein JOZ73_00415 [Solirubrobacterales bacterium]|nr:hypothetical protein [Solirubrobacterales bacterium]